jgi:dCMP deaminase
MELKKIKLFHDIVKRLAEESTCARMKVGALLVSEDARMIATGWNGTAPGKIHCEYVFKNTDLGHENFLKSHHEFSTQEELHAEQNLIAYCAKSGISTKDKILYLTITPCIHCAKLILASGIKCVVYINVYDRDESGLEFLINNGIETYHIQKDDLI